MNSIVRIFIFVLFFIFLDCAFKFCYNHKKISDYKTLPDTENSKTLICKEGK